LSLSGDFSDEFPYHMHWKRSIGYQGAALMADPRNSRTIASPQNLVKKKGVAGESSQEALQGAFLTSKLSKKSPAGPNKAAHPPAMPDAIATPDFQ